MSNICIRIKKIRKSMGLTQKAFAVSLGITQGYVTKVESGIADPSEQLLKLISRTFEINEEWLRNGVGPATVGPGGWSFEHYDLEKELAGLKKLAVIHGFRSWLLQISSVTSNIKEVFGNIKQPIEQNIIDDPSILEYKKRLEESVIELLQTLGVFFNAQIDLSRKIKVEKKEDKQR